jgi:hypothetical protein
VVGDGVGELLLRRGAVVDEPAVVEVVASAELPDDPSEVVPL